MFIPAGYLALQVVVAFVVDNSAGGFDGGDLALVSTGLAGLTTFVAPAQPFKDAKTCYEGKGRAVAEPALSPLNWGTATCYGAPG